MTNITLAALKRMTGKQLQSSVPVDVTYNRIPAFTVSAYAAAPSPAPEPTPAPSTPQRLYKAPQQVDKYAGQYPELKAIADQPVGVWLGGWSGDITVAVKTVCDKAKSLNQIPLLVVYNIPNRDNGGYSAGGASDPAKYRTWIDALAAGITTPSLIVLEPDAIVHHTDATRIELMKYAIERLMATQSKVYIDAGHPNWHSVDEVSNRLHLANVRYTTGFALNTSNFVDTPKCREYGEAVAKRLVSLGDGVKTYVVDTSRNGNGSNGEWCNPSGRALGESPKLLMDSRDSAAASLDAYLWVKAPGESDGTCAGGPNAGEFWVDYARGLVKEVA